jgi:spermidine synthase
VVPDEAGAADGAAAPARTEPLDAAAPPGEPGPPAGSSGWTPRTWYLIYATTGAIALSYEIVMLRVVAGVMRSNTYTFGHVLGIYLGLLAAGGLLGAWVRPRIRDHRQAFLWLQFAVGASAAAGIVLFVHVLPRSPLGGRIEAWLATDGFAGGFGAGGPQLVLFGVVMPLLLMAVPVMAMGAAHPFAQGLVIDDLAHVGDRTGHLLFANVVGNVLGTMLSAFVLIDRLGSAGTLRLLVVLLSVAGVVAAVLASGRRRVAGACAVALVLLGVATAMPTNAQLWEAMANPDTDELVLAEDRSCASSLEQRGGSDDYMLAIDATSQNGYPFDDFHVLIGLLPPLVHPDPSRGLAIGLGIGSTSYGMLASQEVEQVTTVELCGGNYRLVERLAELGIEPFVRLVDDPGHRELVDDGRRHLLVTDERYDLIVPDTVRPNAPGANNLYSQEFQQLVADRLAPGGITAGWVPSYRSLNAVTTTFPYVVSLTVDSYNRSEFYLASAEPIPLDTEELATRVEALPDDVVPAAQRAALAELLRTATPTCYADGRVAEVGDPSDLNRDLAPRDEYVLAQGAIDASRIARTCG